MRDEGARFAHRFRGGGIAIIVRTRIRIIHHVLNQRADTAAELTFAPWPDAEAEMRRLGIPLFSLDTQAPAQAFDIIGFSLQYELQYTNVLMMLELAGLPLHSRDRDGSHALVIAGGAQAFSPEPMSEFIDAFVIGDGEEVIHAVVDHVKRAKREHFLVVLLNARHEVEAVETVSIGSLNASIVHPREVFKPAIVESASSVILLHNHPSGDPTPSEADIKVTRDLIRAGQVLKIDLLDHVILGRRTAERTKDYASLRELGYFYA